MVLVWYILAAWAAAGVCWGWWRAATHLFGPDGAYTVTTRVLAVALFAAYESLAVLIYANAFHGVGIGCAIAGVLLPLVVLTGVPRRSGHSP